MSRTTDTRTMACMCVFTSLEMGLEFGPANLLTIDDLLKAQENKMTASYLLMIMIGRRDGI